MNFDLHHTLALGEVASPDAGVTETPRLWRLL